MGIDGLLPLLKPLCKQEHISSFKGQTLGIDILPWLYKGCYSHILQMSQKQLNKQLKYSCSAFLFEMLNMFAHNQIKVIAVFDGRSLPMKAATIKKRKQSREYTNKKGQKMIEEKQIEMGRKFFARGIRIDESIIQEAIWILKAKKNQFIVAPYQSDCQLSKLKRLGLIDAVVSQDSDLLVYGCNVIYKLDQEGMCQYLDLANYKNLDSQDLNNYKYLKQFLSFDHDTRIYACVLAGCDYISSIRGIGIKKAICLLERHNDIVQLIDNLEKDKLFGERVPKDYQNNVINAVKIFKYATVFNPKQKRLQTLNHVDEEEQIGKIIGQPYKQYIDMCVYSGQTIATSLLPRKIRPLEIKETKQTQILTTCLKKLVNQMGLGIDEQPTSSLIQDNMFETLKMLQCDNKAQMRQVQCGETIFWQNLINLSVINILQL